MTFSDVTIILPLRDRPIETIQNCLNSLSRQNPLPKAIVVDMGSEEELTAWLRENIPSEQVRLIEVINKEEKFCIGRAINIGIKTADTKYVAASNIDCVFSDEFMAKVIPFLKERLFITCRLTDLDKEGKPRIDPKRHQSKYALGGFILTSKEWAMKVHGMDEYYKVWGFDDMDYYYRAMWDGLNRIELSSLATLYHQWHEPININAIKGDVERNRAWFIKNKNVVIRNKEAWGEI